MNNFRSKYAYVLKSIKKDTSLVLHKNNIHKKTFIISGSSRGIGFDIAKKLAICGANVTLVGKTVNKQEKLEGTIYSARDEINELIQSSRNDNECIAVPCDIRDSKQIDNVIDETMRKFRKLDGVVLNASALCLKDTLNQTEKELNLMNSVNINGTYLFGQKCLKVMNKNKEGKMLIISPPLDVLYNNDWWTSQMSKFNMTLMAKFWNEEFSHIGVNTLWPRTTINTAPVKNILGGDEMLKISRKTDIMGDAARIILNSPTDKCQGKNFIDDEVLVSVDLDPEIYKVSKNVNEKDLMPDFFV